MNQARTIRLFDPVTHIDLTEQSPVHLAGAFKVGNAMLTNVLANRPSTRAFWSTAG